MTRRLNWTLTFAIWMAGLIPATLVAIWLGLADWTWRGFATAYILLAVICLAYEVFARWVEGYLRRRRERSKTSMSEH